MEHHVRKHRLQVTIDSEALALALQSRLQDLNQTGFLPTMARVFDELSPANRRVFLDRLEIDLGTLSVADLDQVVERFERQLREALLKAIHRIEEEPSSEERVEPDEGAQLEVLERYLLTGTLPFWVPARSFDLEEWIARLSSTAREGLVDLLDRRRLDPLVVHRLVRQLEGETVERLVRQVRPAIPELYRTDRQAFLALLGDGRERAAVEQFLETLDATRLEELLRQVAPSEAARLLPGLEEIRRNEGRDRANEATRSMIVALARPTLHPSPPLPAAAVDEERLQELYATDRAGFVTLVRVLGPSPLVDHFLLRLDSAALTDLVRLLAPASSDQITADIFELANLDYFTRRESYAQALRHLWLLGADVQLTMLDRPYERPAFVRALLMAFAANEGQVVDDVIAAISWDWPPEVRPETRGGLDSVALRSLVADMAAGGSLARPSAAPSSDAARSQAASSVRASDAPSPLAPPSTRMADASGRPAPAPQPLFARYDLAEAIEYYIRHGVLPYSVALLRPALTVDDALDVLPEMPLRVLRSVVADLDAEARLQAWQRVVRDLTEDRRTRFVAALIAQRGLPPADTWSQLSAGLAGLAGLNETHVYTAFIVRLIEEERTATPSEPAAMTDAPHGASEPAWEAHHIKAVLTSRARGIAPTGSDEPGTLPGSLSLLLTLIELDLEGARHFIGALKQAGIAASVMVDEAPSRAALDIIQRLLPPEVASGLLPLFELVAALDPAERPAIERAIAEAILDWRPESQPADVLVATLLKQLAIPPVAGIPGIQDVGQGVDDVARRVDDVQRHVDDVEPRVDEVESRVRDIQREVRDGDWQIHGVEGPRADETASRPARPAEAPMPPAWLTRILGVPAAGSAASLPDDVNRHALLRAIDDTPDAVFAALVERLGDRGIRDRWVRELSESELVRMTYLLEPRRHRVLMDAAELLFFASVRAVPDPGSRRLERRTFWSFVFGFLAETRSADRSLEHLAAGFFAAFGAGQLDGVAAGSVSEATRAATTRRLLDAAVERATALGHNALRAVLLRDREALTSARAAEAPRPPVSPDRPGGMILRRDIVEADRDRLRLAFTMDVGGTDRVDGAEPIYVANAGLVLANPFLPQWLRALDFLEELDPGKVRLRPERVSRAVHLLQWLVDRSTATPEPMLSLNKLLCGVPLETPVARRIEPTERELEVCELLLKSMLANWPIISSASIEGLQETFLQREGRLDRTGAGWLLMVQRKTVDVLVDQIPWSISTVFHSWMPEPVSVTW